MSARFDRLATNVIYASRAGVPSSPYNAAGPDATPALQAILDLYGATTAPVHLILDINVTVHDLKLYSNTILEGLPGTSVFQGAGGTCAIRNKHWVSSYNGGGTPIMDGSNIVDQNIQLRNIYINGNGGTGSTVNASGGGTNSTAQYCGQTLTTGVYGQLVMPIQFYGVKNVVMDTVSYYDAACYGTHLANAFNCTLKNMYAKGLIANTVLLQVNGPADNIQAPGSSFDVVDDGIAFNADDWNTLPAVIPSLQGPQIFGSLANVYQGPITNCVVSGLKLNGTASAGAINSGAVHACDNITFRDVSGTVRGYGIRFSGTAVGRVLLENWAVDMTAINASLGFIAVEANVADLTIRDFRRNLYLAHLDSIVVGAGTSGRITVDGYSIRGTSSAGLGNVVEVQAGASLATLQLSNIYADGIPNIVSYNAGSLTEITTSNLRHRNAGGSNPSILVGSGMTLSRLRSAASNTAILVGTPAGTITSKKTDGTEDAN